MRTFKEWLGRDKLSDLGASDMETDYQRHPSRQPKMAMDKLTGHTFYVDRIEGNMAYVTDDNGKQTKMPLDRLEMQS